MMVKMAMARSREGSVGTPSTRCFAAVQIGITDAELALQGVVEIPCCADTA